MKVLIVCFLMALSVSSIVSVCLEDADCAATQCCAGTPNGARICLEYHKLDEQCIFHSRTPSCGCATGLQCHYKEGTGHCRKVEEY